MTSESEILRKAAAQLIETDMMLGGEFMPKTKNPIPARKAGPSAKAEPAVAGQTATRSTAPQADIPELSVDEKAKKLAEINARVKKCTACQLCQTRTNTVFGEGDHNARLVFVGEAPGEDEDLSGRPFVGRAGELLTKMILAMGLARENVFICNMLKCRPPNNRAPNPEEIQSCWNFLTQQLQTIRPAAIVTLGNPATQGLLNTKVGITKLRGNWQELPDIAPGLGGTPVMPTFHPAYVLRQYTEETRGKVWDDLKKVMEKLGLKLPGK